MKTIKCELCGSNDIVKNDGVYVCQSCGTKYSTEEAKKMMVEGTVSIQGSVKINNDDKIKNYLMMAENAYDADNKKEAEKYCNKVIEEEPNNYKAWMLKGKSAGWQSTIVNLRIEEAVNAFQKAIDNSPEEEKDDIKKESTEELSKLCKALNVLACNHYMEYASADNATSIINTLIVIKKIALSFLGKCGIEAKDISAELAVNINAAVVDAYSNQILPDYLGTDGHPSEYDWNEYIEKTRAAIVLIETAVDLSDGDNKEDKIRYENLIKLTKDLEESKSYTYSADSDGYVTDKCFNTDYKNELIDKIMTYHEKIKEIDPSYVVPNRPRPSSGCYVATAVYGSYDCPEVWTLRRFRDYTLDMTWYGRTFINIYYAISPKIVKMFGNKKWFNFIFKKHLDKMVSKLQAKGIESTPYEDKY